jgi:hypothetical protein
MIELVLDVIFGSTPRELCTAYLGVPLPCGRRLWEPVSDAEWTRRYHQYLSSGMPDLRIQDLKLSAAGASEAVNEESEGLAAWCEDLDDFGTLVWMAGMLERSNG